MNHQKIAAIVNGSYEYDCFGYRKRRTYYDKLNSNYERLSDGDRELFAKLIPHAKNIYELMVFVEMASGSARSHQAYLSEGDMYWELGYYDRHILKAIVSLRERGFVITGKDHCWENRHNLLLTGYEQDGWNPRDIYKRDGV